jgi:F-type H+-transporting ATPase subunit b
MENLGIDAKLLIAQLVNFGLFYILFKKFIAKPFLNLIKDEEVNEKKQEELRIKLQKQDEDLEAKRSNFNTQISKEEEDIISKAKERAKTVEAKIISVAEEEALRIKEKALKEIQSEKQDLYKQIKNKISTLSLLLVNKTLRDVLTDDVKKRITSSIIKNLPKEKHLYEN